MISSNRKTKNYGSELGVKKAGKNITTIFYWILAFFILNTISYIVNLNIWEDVSYENYESILEFAKVWSEIYNIIEFVIIFVILINIKNAGYYLKNHDTSFKV